MTHDRLDDQYSMVLFRVVNSGVRDLIFWLEPMARRYEVPPQTTFVIALREGHTLGEPPTLDIDGEHDLKIWCAGDVEVLHDGKSVDPLWP